MSPNEDSKSKPTVFDPNTERLLSILAGESQSIKKASSERERLQYGIYQDERGRELGLTKVWAYHCSRCNYTWLPKDFDLDRWEPFKKNGKWGISGQDLFFREPPKSCARCKSKYWRKDFMKRISKSAKVGIDEYGNIMEPTSWERWRMLIRQGQFLNAVRLRPDSKELMLKHKLLMKFKKDGRQYITDGKHYLKEPEPERKKVTKET